MIDGDARHDDDVDDDDDDDDSSSDNLGSPETRKELKQVAQLSHEKLTNGCYFPSEETQWPSLVIV